MSRYSNIAVGSLVGCEIVAARTLSQHEREPAWVSAVGYEQRVPLKRVGALRLGVHLAHASAVMVVTADHPRAIHVLAERAIAAAVADARTDEHRVPEVAGAPLRAGLDERPVDLAPVASKHDEVPASVPLDDAAAHVQPGRVLLPGAAPPVEQPRQRGIPAPQGSFAPTTSPNSFAVRYGS